MKGLAALLCVLLLFTALASCSAEEDRYEYDYDCWGEITLWADFTDEERTADAICWQEDEQGTLTLYLPAGMNEFYVWFDGANAVRIDGAGVREGDLCAFADGCYTLKAGEYSYDFNIKRSSGLASLIITSDRTDEPIDGRLHLRSDEGNTEFNGGFDGMETVFDSALSFRTASDVTLFGLGTNGLWMLCPDEGEPFPVPDATSSTLMPIAGDFFACEVWSNGLYLGQYRLYELCEAGLLPE